MAFSFQKVRVYIPVGITVPPQQFEGRQWKEQKPSGTCTVELAWGAWEEFAGCFFVCLFVHFLMKIPLHRVVLWVGDRMYWN